MTAAKPALPNLPPRLLSRDQAAAYVGLSPNAFEAEVELGTFPTAIELGGTRRRLWDRAAIDRALDKLSGIPQASLNGEPDYSGVWENKRRQWGENGPAALG